MAVENSDYVNSLYIANEEFTIYSGTVVGKATVEDYGELYVHEGGVVSDAAVNEDGYMDVSSGGRLDKSEVNAGGMLFIEGLASNVEVNSDGLAGIVSGGIANDTVVNEGGTLNVGKAGIANNTVANFEGNINVFSGGTANIATINSGASMLVNGGSASGISVNFGGVLWIGGQWIYGNGGGCIVTDINVFEGGHVRMDVAPGLFARGNSAGSAFEINDGFISEYTVRPDDCLYVFAGGSATYTTVSGYNLDDQWHYGYMCVDGGVAIDTTADAYCICYVISGGTANSTVIKTDGRLYVSDRKSVV